MKKLSKIEIERRRYILKYMAVIFTMLFTGILVMFLILGNAYGQESTNLPEDGDGSALWSWQFNNKILWLGEKLLINITGPNNTYCQLEIRLGNYTINEDIITDENGTANFKIPLNLDMPTGSYTVSLYSDNSVAAALVTGITLNHDTETWLRMSMEELEADILDLQRDNDGQDLVIASQKDEINTLWQVVFLIFSIVIMFVLWQAWMFWDEYTIKFEKMRDLAGGKRSQFSRLFKFSNPGIERDGERAMTKESRFKDGDRLGREGTKHDAEKKRREKMRRKRHKINFKELTKAPPEPTLRQRVKRKLAKHKKNKEEDNEDNTDYEKEDD